VGGGGVGECEYKWKESAKRKKPFKRCWKGTNRNQGKKTRNKFLDWGLGSLVFH
jgi:hypothetical protein